MIYKAQGEHVLDSAVWQRVHCHSIDSKVLLSTVGACVPKLQGTILSDGQRLLLLQWTAECLPIKPHFKDTKMVLYRNRFPDKSFVKDSYFKVINDSLSVLIS